MLCFKHIKDQNDNAEHVVEAETVSHNTCDEKDDDEYVPEEVNITDDAIDTSV